MAATRLADRCGRELGGHCVAPAVVTDGWLGPGNDRQVQTLHSVRRLKAVTRSMNSALTLAKPRGGGRRRGDRRRRGSAGRGRGL